MAAGEVSSSGVIAALWGDDAQGEEIADGLKARSDWTVSTVDNLDELEDLIGRGPVICVLCSDTALGSGLPMLGNVLDRVAGRRPVIFLVPDNDQNAAIQAFRRGARDCVAMTGACVDELIEAVERLRNAAGRSAQPAGPTHDDASEAGAIVQNVLSPEQLMCKLDEMQADTGDAGVLAIQIMDLGYFATKFGRRTAEELSREFAKRLSLALGGGGVFCRRPDASFVALLTSVSGMVAFETAIGQISNQLSFAVRLSDLDFRVEGVIGACDFRAANDALQVIECADNSLEKAMARGARYHIAHAAIYGMLLQHSSARGRSRKANRRRGERSRVNKRGKLVLPHLNATVDCTVLDVSSTGARLSINSSLVTPDEFELTLPNQAGGRQVKVRWRRHKELGVEFTDQPS